MSSTAILRQNPFLSWIHFVASSWRGSGLKRLPSSIYASRSVGMWTAFLGLSVQGTFAQDFTVRTGHYPDLDKDVLAFHLLIDVMGADPKNRRQRQKYPL